MREWANANGHQVSDRGRIPAEVQAAYQAANK
ncbi:Lsr2 family DNA-binding protein [Rathayibacter oskolensis]